MNPRAVPSVLISSGRPTTDASNKADTTKNSRNRKAAPRNEVLKQPPMRDERVATYGSWARRSENSATGRARAAHTTRLALVAINVARLIAWSKPLSSRSASANGAVTRSSGSLGKAIEPSGMARISPLKRSSLRYSRNAGS